ncbi:phosphatidylserine decarboxylase [Prolixibacteraceae bacterium JC049]|nr:phosphatidylserine decarboxylase [Prolixibacteraceae bacterium JC049]
MKNDIIYINRTTGEQEVELVPGGGTLKFLYGTTLGRFFLWGLMKRKLITAVVGRMMDRSFSKRYVNGFIQKNGVNIEESQKQKFDTFNDFFYRKLKQEVRVIEDGVVSPADGKILAFQSVQDEAEFFVKGTPFCLAHFLGDEKLAEKYAKGSMAIIRLAPADYHRFHFPFGGKVSETNKIKGKYASVSPLALRKSLRIFCENKREYAVLKSNSIGDVIIAEVGATMVGSILQTYQAGSEVKKGDEKGYFKFGGSTVVLLFEPNTVQFNADLLQNSKSGFETTVLMGQTIATPTK